MSYSTITNDQRAVYIMCNHLQTPAYKRLGEGINTFTPSNNGQISTKHYINDKFATSRRNGLQKQFAFSGDRVIGDDANDFLVSCSEKTGSAVESSIIICDLMNGTSGTGTTTYDGKKYDVMVDVSNDGTIEGGQDVTIDGTLYVNGDPIEGTVSISTSTGAVTWTDASAS